MVIYDRVVIFVVNILLNWKNYLELGIVVIGFCCGIVFYELFVVLFVNIWLDNLWIDKIVFVCNCYYMGFVEC